MQADIAGNQRKLVRSRIRPVRSAYGADGIAVRDGKTLPFVVARGWNAPAGNYPEAFYIVDPKTSEVYYESPPATRLIWGLPAVTDVETDNDATVVTIAYRGESGETTVRSSWAEIEGRPMITNLAVG